MVRFEASLGVGFGAAWVLWRFDEARVWLGLGEAQD